MDMGVLHEFRIGQGYTSGKECLPAIITTGSLVKYLRERKDNDEVLVKITNSVARKYDCRITLDDYTGESSSDCDENAKDAIIQEISDIFGIE